MGQQQTLQHLVTHSTKTCVMHDASGNGVYPGMFCCVVKPAVEPPKAAVVDDDDDVFVDESSAPLSPATNGTTKGLLSVYSSEHLCIHAILQCQSIKWKQNLSTILKCYQPVSIWMYLYCINISPISGVTCNRI